MHTISDLIKKIQFSSPEKHIAIMHLISMSTVSFPLIAKAIRECPDLEAEKLSQVISGMRNDEVVPLLINLLNDTNVYLRTAAIEALGKSKNKLALQPLLDLLLDEKSSFFLRSLAAQALGELGYCQSKDGLIKVVYEVLDEPLDAESITRLIRITKDKNGGRKTKATRQLTMLLNVIVALAKLGDNKFSHLVIQLTKYGLDDATKTSSDAILRENAVVALKYVVGSRLLPTLKFARQAEIADPIVLLDTFLLLGVKESVEELIDCVKDNYPIPQYSIQEVIIRIFDIVGEWPPKKEMNKIDITDLKEWWKEKQLEFQPLTCYRLGKPICPSILIQKLQEPHFQPEILLTELHIITGNDFGFNPIIPIKYQPEVFKKSQTWWGKNKQNFEVGQLYKYGHKQDINKIY